MNNAPTNPSLFFSYVVPDSKGPWYDSHIKLKDLVAIASIQGQRAAQGDRCLSSREVVLQAIRDAEEYLLQRDQP